MNRPPVDYRDMIREHFKDVIREDPSVVVYLETTPYNDIIATVKAVIREKEAEVTNEQGIF